MSYLTKLSQEIHIELLSKRDTHVFSIAVSSVKAFAESVYLTVGDLRTWSIMAVPKL